ncbi:hypothetical protein COX08_00120 [Candidatus Beckwithbacteria bacterium CG23_combo_of_CG06-09_8_20_14_all_34_8]|uniref:Uncharacterized protein n=1 Tax=Candidatus Beckwithbacteria bacterium CG23_combo_of_CG06-09_8_20_14_all_34_8 TaxID=1974497 RepID=A0A2H0B959_9BACT|nr:MAG: hypothetical protein COX08_00120 [Candidatus Beckwithbacteria bacterium CG23_combo_of_CG06-09_8_20_14_all_34_8]
MDIISQIFNVNLDTALLGGLKIMYLAAIFFYIIFASLIIKQIYLMTGTLISSVSKRIELIGWVNLFFAIGIFFFALVAL